MGPRYLALPAQSEARFIRLGKPAENGFIENFNGKLREECLNSEAFLSIDDARESLSSGGMTIPIFARTAAGQIGLRPTSPESAASAILLPY